MEKIAKKTLAGILAAGALAYGIYDATRTNPLPFTETYQGNKAPNYEGKITLVFYNDSKNKPYEVTSASDYDSVGNKLQIGKNYKVDATVYNGLISGIINDKPVAEKITPVNN